MNENTREKVLVIGLDGVSWNVIDTLIELGLMPSLGELKSNSKWGNLRSSIPPVTFPAWRCYSTGRDPSQLGVYWWMNVDFEKQKFIANNSNSFRGKDIWDYLSESNKKSIIINMPGTYPVKKINGILIAGPPNPSLGKSVYPPELLTKLIAMSYSTMPNAKWSVEHLKVIKESREIQKKQFKLALSLMKKYRWDFFQMTFILTDPILHYFWEYHEKMKDANDEVTQELKKFWIELDYYIERLISEAGKDTYTFIISDHGMTKMKGKIYINNILKDEKYLKLKEKSYLLNSIIAKLPKKQIASTLSKLHLLDPASRILNKIGALDKFNPAVDIELNEELINWRATRALNLSDVVSLIYTQNMKPHEKEELINLLQDIKYKNKKIFEEIYLAEEIYQSPSKETPSIIAIPKEGYEIAPGLGSDFFKPTEKDVWKATHRKDGLVLIHGSTVSPGSISADIYDIAPTILSLLQISDNKFSDMVGNPIEL